MIELVTFIGFLVVFLTLADIWKQIKRIADVMVWQKERQEREDKNMKPSTWGGPGGGGSAFGSGGRTS